LVGWLVERQKGEAVHELSLVVSGVCVCVTFRRGMLSLPDGTNTRFDEKRQDNNKDKTTKKRRNKKQSKGHSLPSLFLVLIFVTVVLSS
jgi:hypothetical protein